MTVWSIIPDGNTYRSFHVLNLSPGKVLDITKAFRSGQALGTVWMPMRVEFFEYEGEDHKKVGNFPSFVGAPLAISAHALDALYPLIKENVEVLELITDIGNYYALNVFTCDCLDHSRAILERFTDGELMRVERYAFQPGCLEGKHIFRLPEKWTHTLVDDTFKRAVEENGLEGLLFFQVPEADSIIKSVTSFF